MKPIVLKSILVFVVLCFLSSCHNDSIPDDSIPDYLPLTVGAKYLYSYSASYNEPGYANPSEKGECQWEFIDRNSTPPYVYRARQTLNGIHVMKYVLVDRSDTTVISNRIDTITFKEDGNGKVEITFPVMYWGHGSMSVERYFESSKTDTCIGYLPLCRRICLTKNVGVKSLDYCIIANHSSSTSYTLVKGPY